MMHVYPVHVRERFTCRIITEVIFGWVGTNLKSFVIAVIKVGGWVAFRMLRHQVIYLDFYDLAA